MNKMGICERASLCGNISCSHIREHIWHESCNTYCSYIKGQTKCNVIEENGNIFKYNKLKSLSPLHVLSCDGISEKDFENYLSEARSFFKEPNTETLNSIFKKYPILEEILIKNGYIEARNSISVSVGDVFKVFKNIDIKFTIKKVDFNTVILSSENDYFVSSTIYGEYGSNVVHNVKDAHNMTIDEFKKMLGGEAPNWREIYKTKKRK